MVVKMLHRVETKCMLFYNTIKYNVRPRVFSRATKLYM